MLSPAAAAARVHLAADQPLLLGVEQDETHRPRGTAPGGQEPRQALGRRQYGGDAAPVVVGPGRRIGGGIVGARHTGAVHVRALVAGGIEMGRHQHRAVRASDPVFGLHIGDPVPPPGEGAQPYGQAERGEPVGQRLRDEHVVRARRVPAAHRVRAALDQRRGARDTGDVGAHHLRGDGRAHRLDGLLGRRPGCEAGGRLPDGGLTRAGQQCRVGEQPLGVPGPGTRQVDPSTGTPAAAAR